MLTSASSASLIERTGQPPQQSRSVAPHENLRVEGSRTPSSSFSILPKLNPFSFPKPRGVSSRKDTLRSPLRAELLQHHSTSQQVTHSQTTFKNVCEIVEQNHGTKAYRSSVQSTPIHVEARTTRVTSSTTGGLPASPQHLHHRPQHFLMPQPR